MKISKWGNSLAVRLPSSVVEALSLKEGDEIDLRRGVESKSVFIRRKLSKDELRSRVRALRGAMPPGFKFSRDEPGEG